MCPNSASKSVRRPAGSPPGVADHPRIAHRSRAKAIVEGSGRDGSGREICRCGSLHPFGQVVIGDPGGEARRNAQRGDGACHLAEQSTTPARSKPGCAGRPAIHPSPARRFGITSDSVGIHRISPNIMQTKVRHNRDSGLRPCSWAKPAQSEPCYGKPAGGSRATGHQGRRTGSVFGAGACSSSECSGSFSPCTSSAGPIQIGSAR